MVTLDRNLADRDCPSLLQVCEALLLLAGQKGECPEK